MTLFRRQQNSPRLWLPSDEGRAIRVDFVGGASDRIGGRRIRGPLKIGYGNECDLQLDGGAGPDVLLELQRTDQPVWLSAVRSTEDVNRCVELYVNGELVSAPVRNLKPGSRVELVDKASRRRYAMVVDPSRPVWLRPKVLLAVVGVLTLAGGIYGAYLFLALERTQGNLSETRGQVEQTGRQFEQLLQRFESSEADLGRSVLALQATLSAAEQQLRGDFDRALAEIGRKSTEGLQQIEERDVLARAELESRTRDEIDALRNEFSDRMVAAYRDFKNIEGRVTDALAKRMAASEPASERFKRVFHKARDSVVFVQVRYRIEFTRSGDISEAGGFGTGYLISSLGLGLTAQHVLYPWRYDDRLTVLRKLDLARIPPDSVRWSIWPTGTRVANFEPTPADSGARLGESDIGVVAEPQLDGDAALPGYHSNSPRNAMRVLYAPEPTVATAQVAAPIGMIEVSVPRPDHTDVAVFQLMAFDRTVHSVPAIDPGIAVESLDESLVIGYPFSRLQEGVALPQGVRGSVRRVGAKLLELDTPLHPGLSGAPVLNREGHLLGMVVAVLQSEVYGVAIRAGALREAVDGSIEAVRREEVRLAAIGCDPGVIDGVFDRHTASAYACERRQSRGTGVDAERSGSPAD